MSTGLIKNGYLVSPDFEIENGAVFIENDRIARIIEPGTPLPKADWVYDAQGKMVVPGFIDIHCHGAGGMDVTDDDPGAVEAVAKAKLAEGCTSFAPTTLTLSEEMLAGSLKNIAAYAKKTPYAKVLGVHLEGPYINDTCLGAQNPAYVRTPDIEEVKRLNAIAKVSQVSYAAEIPGGAAFAAALLDMGIVPSCGHSKCSFKEFKPVYAAGMRHLTHFCNQMTALHHRDVGLVGAGFLLPDVRSEIICDLIHLCPEMIELIFQVKEIDSIVMITDSMRASHLPDGPSSLGGLDVIVKDGQARLASDGALAGSVLKMNVALKNVYSVTDLPLSDLIKATSHNQAVEQGLGDELGCLEPGYRADITVLDDPSFEVAAVFVDGVRKI